MTPNALLDEILRLPAEQQIQLVAEVWDRIAASPANVPVPEWHRAELDRRLADPASWARRQFPFCVDHRVAVTGSVPSGRPGSASRFAPCPRPAFPVRGLPSRRRSGRRSARLLASALESAGVAPACVCHNPDRYAVQPVRSAGRNRPIEAPSAESAMRRFILSIGALIAPALGFAQLTPSVVGSWRLVS